MGVIKFFYILSVKDNLQMQHNFSDHQGPMIKKKFLISIHSIKGRLFGV